jgi:hypothetical protein
MHTATDTATARTTSRAVRPSHAVTACAAAQGNELSVNGRVTTVESACGVTACAACANRDLARTNRQGCSVTLNQAAATARTAARVAINLTATATATASDKNAERLGTLCDHQISRGSERVNNPCLARAVVVRHLSDRAASCLVVERRRIRRLDLVLHDNCASVASSPRVGAAAAITSTAVATLANRDSKADSSLLASARARLRVVVATAVAAISARGRNAYAPITTSDRILTPSTAATATSLQATDRGIAASPAACVSASSASRADHNGGNADSQGHFT